MPAHDFLKMSEEELLARADECLKRADSALEVAPPNFDDFTKLRLFLEAQSYLSEVLRRQAERTAERDRLRNEEIAERDFRVERLVVWLIGAEIFLSLVFGIFGISEGIKQTKVLSHMDTGTAATATAMTAASTSLKTLAEDQIKSIDRLNQMNDTLRDSLTRSSTMASATRKQ